jgi:hypothetical protein
MYDSGAPADLHARGGGRLWLIQTSTADLPSLFHLFFDFIRPIHQLFRFLPFLRLLFVCVRSPPHDFEFAFCNDDGGTMCLDSCPSRSFVGFHNSTQPFRSSTLLPSSSFLGRLICLMSHEPCQEPPEQPTP